MARTGKTRHRTDPIDTSLLSDEQKEAVAKLASEEVKAEMQKEQKDALLARLKEEARRKHDPEEELFHYVINLPPCGGDHLKIDGVVYMHGVGYDFTKAQLAGIKEVEHRLGRHEAEIKGERQDEMQRLRDFRVGNRGVMTTSNLMRV